MLRTHVTKFWVFRDTQRKCRGPGISFILRGFGAVPDRNLLAGRGAYCTGRASYWRVSAISRVRGVHSFKAKLHLARLAFNPIIHRPTSIVRALHVASRPSRGVVVVMFVATFSR